MPARGLIGYRQEFMTDTKGNGIINSVFDSYAPYKGDIPKRKEGSLISFETGESTGYGLHAAQERGILFIAAGVPVYTGMVIGSNAKGLDIDVNVCRKKQQSNVRSSGADESLKLSPARNMSLEEALEFIDYDELIEVTPLSFRIRKKILDSNKRYRANK
jgi:GTP-binding protein